MQQNKCKHNPTIKFKLPEFLLLRLYSYTGGNIHIAVSKQYELGNG